MTNTDLGNVTLINLRTAARHHDPRLEVEPAERAGRCWTAHLIAPDGYHLGDGCASWVGTGWPEDGGASAAYRDLMDRLSDVALTPDGTDA